MNGEIAIPFIYDKLGGFAKNGLACAAKDGKYGYIGQGRYNCHSFYL